MDKYILLLTQILPLLKPNKENKSRKVKKRKRRELKRARKDFVRKFEKDGVVTESEQLILDKIDEVLVEMTLDIAR